MICLRKNTPPNSGTDPNPGICWIWVLAFSILSCTSLNAQQFTEVAQGLGIQHVYGLGNFGGGVSFYDFNGDGWDDLTFATANGDSIYFYENLGGTFQKVSPCPIPFTGEAKQILWADIDNDGDADLFVAGHNAPCQLYENRGNLHLVDITVNAGISTASMPTFGAAFVDFDKDGYLDLYLVNRTLGGVFTPNRNFFYRNQGNHTFQDITLAVGLADSNKAPFCASFFDMNNNGWEDAYIAHDKYFYGNVLLKHTGNGTYSDISVGSGADRPMDAMCIAIGDYNQDGFLDLYCTNTLGGNSLFHNNGNETFTDTADGCGVGFYGTSSWGANFLDYDNDLDLDLYVSGEFIGSNPVSSKLYENNGLGHFLQPVGAGFVGDTGRSFANALGDFNNDGWVDIAVTNFDQESSQLWANSGGSQNWLRLELEGTLSNRDAVGSRIEYWVGGQRYLRTTHCGISYLGQNSGVEILGLGPYNGVDTLRITWPNGGVETYYNLCGNRKVKLKEGVVSLPVPQVVSANGTLLCSGDTLDLAAGNFVGYQWSTGDSGATIQVTAPGVYWVNVVDSNGQCGGSGPVRILPPPVGPFAICQDQTVYLDTTGTASLDPASVQVAAPDPCRNFDLQLSKSGFHCNDVGTVQVVLTASLDAVPMDSCTARILVRDTLAPVAACRNLTVELDGLGNGVISVDSVDNASADVCGLSQLRLLDGTFDCSSIGTLQWDMLVVEDVNGNLDSCHFNYTVLDRVAPQAVCQDITLQLDPNGQALLSPAQIDGGSTDACGLSGWQISDSLFMCGQIGSKPVQLSVSDASGNSSQCIAQVSVEDTTSPLAQCQDISVFLDGNGQVPLTPGAMDAGSWDICGIHKRELSSSLLTCDDLGLKMVTLSVWDRSGNQTQCTAQVEVFDTLPPFLNCRDIDLYLDENGEGGLQYSDVILGMFGDNCSPVGTPQLSKDHFVRSDTGINGVTVSMVDGSGNLATCLSTITVIDSFGVLLSSALHTSGSLDFQAFPNPTNDLVVLKVHSGSTSLDNSFQIRLVDELGRTVWKRNESLKAKEHSYTIPLSQFSGRVFSAVLLLDSTSLSRRIIRY